MNAENGSDATQRGILKGGWALIRAHWRSYLVCHVIYYGVLILGFVVVASKPEIQQALTDAIGQAYSGGGVLGAVGEAYSTGQVLRAVGLTFVVNLIVGTLLELTLPSLIVPFSGWLVGLFRALLWGFIFFPSSSAGLGDVGVLPMLSVALLLLLEGEGYVIALFAAWLQGRTLLFHRRLGYEGPWQGYLAGLKQTGLLYIPVIIVLVVAAIYEVLIAVVLV